MTIWFVALLVCCVIYLVVSYNDLWNTRAGAGKSSTPGAGVTSSKAVGSINDRELTVAIRPVLDSPTATAAYKVQLLETAFFQRSIYCLARIENEPCVVWQVSGVPLYEAAAEARKAFSCSLFESADFFELQSHATGRPLFWGVTRGPIGGVDYLVGYSKCPTSLERAVVELIGSYELYSRGLADSQSAQDESAVSGYDNGSSGIPRLVSHLCHDIRTPLNTITSLASLLEDESDAGARKRQAGLVRLYVAMAGELLRGVVSVGVSRAKATPNSIAAGARNNPVGDVVRELGGMFLPLAEEKGLTLEINCCDSSMRYSLAESSFRRILLNLLSNAFKYTKSGGVQVNTRDNTQSLTIQFKDTGIGMSSEQLELLGRPFERFCDETVEGIGVGMSVVKQLCADLGIDVAVTSELGVGTIVELVIPKVEQGLVNSEPTHFSDSEKLVVIADDDQVYCQSLARSLTRLGFRTIAVHTPAELRAVVCFECPQVIISDYRFSDSTSKEMNHWQSLPPSIPIIALTGDTSFETEQKLKAWGAAIVLIKPVHSSRLKNVIDSLTAGKVLSLQSLGVANF
jgi:signal transduction histidine kinase/CheY-like chemotaxis protein